jgi:hypothetical protein
MTKKNKVAYGYVINGWLKHKNSLWVPPVYREPVKGFETKVKVTREGKKITIEET